MDADLADNPILGRSPPRLLSLDAMRGFAMFWLIGGREVVLGIAGFVHPGAFDAAETQLTHKIWHGCVAWDLVMPIFLFAVGAAIPFSLAKYAGQSRPLGPAYHRIGRRVILLWLLGILYQQLHHGPCKLEPFSNALQAIAVGYLVASLAELHLPAAGRCALAAALLLCSDALMTLVPFGGHPAGTLDRSANLARYVDECVLGAFRRDHAFTWIVPSLNFAAIVLLGATAGRLLKKPLPPARRLALLAAAGAACLAAGWLWGYRLPLNRYLWTSPLVLWACGWSFLLLAVLHFTIDLRGLKRWAFPLLVVGSNALLAYMIDPLVDRSTDALATTAFQRYPEHYAELFSSTLELTFIWLILWLLYRRGKYFRV